MSIKKIYMFTSSRGLTGEAEFTYIHRKILAKENTSQGYVIYIVRMIIADVCKLHFCSSELI